MSRIDEIEARANAATEGPWSAGDHVVRGPVLGHANFDAEFIAHARTDVPDLVAFVREMQDMQATYKKLGVPHEWLDEALDRLNGLA